MKSIKGPIWNGEFGPVYASEHDKDHEATNKARYHVLKDQLAVYERNSASWSIWLYKDCGLQGMVHCGLDSPYISLQKEFLKKKKVRPAWMFLATLALANGTVHPQELAADAWGVDASSLSDIFDPVAEWLTKGAESFKERYPRTWGPGRWTARFVRECLLSEELCKEWAKNFAGKSKEELDQLAASFKFGGCRVVAERRRMDRADTRATPQKTACSARASTRFCARTRAAAPTRRSGKQQNVSEGRGS